MLLLQNAQNARLLFTVLHTCMQMFLFNRILEIKHLKFAHQYNNRATYRYETQSARNNATFNNMILSTLSINHLDFIFCFTQKVTYQWGWSSPYLAKAGLRLHSQHSFPWTKKHPAGWVYHIIRPSPLHTIHTTCSISSNTKHYDHAIHAH